MILITGASSGIGEACAKALAREKRGLILVARRLERVQKLATELHAAHGIETHALELDVSRSSDVDAFAQAHAALLSRVEILINNAGLARGLSPLHEGRVSDWDEMIDTNVKGLLYVTRALFPHLLKHPERAHIVNLGSVAGHWTYPRGNVYGATKFAVHALSESLRLDLSGTGVRVTEISPGLVQTEFSIVRLGDASKADAVYSGMTPLTPADVADAIVWAISRPRHVNIQEIVMYPTDQASPSMVHRRS